MTVRYDIRESGKTVESYDKYPIAVKRKNALQRDNLEKKYTVVADYGGAGDD